MRDRSVVGAAVLCVAALMTASCSAATSGLPGEGDVKETGGGFASMPTIAETSSAPRRDGYFQGAMLGRRYNVVFEMLTPRCRAVVGSAEGVPEHLGRWDELPKDLGYDQAERDSDVVVSNVLWKGRPIGFTWRREAGVWRLDTCDIG